MANTYPRGSTSRLTGTFLDDTGAKADPTVVTIYIMVGDDDPLIITAGIARDDVGIYHYDYDVPERPGTTIAYRFKGTGAVKASKESAIQVETSQFPPG